MREVFAVTGKDDGAARIDDHAAAVCVQTGSYGSVDLGATMALIMLSILPIIIFYLFCQKYIIAGVTSGAVKG